MMNFRILTIACVALGFALSGCTNTAEGVGRDIENAGKSIQRTF